MPHIVERLRALMAGDVMATRVVQLSADHSLDDAAQKLVNHDLSSAPVVDGEGLCVGMLSAMDFLKPTLRDGVVDATGMDRNVRALMTSGVQSVSPTTPLLQVAMIMSMEHIHHLPVMDDERIVGVVSTLDVVAAMVNAVNEWDATHPG